MMTINEIAIINLIYYGVGIVSGIILILVLAYSLKETHENSFNNLYELKKENQRLKIENHYLKKEQVHSGKLNKESHYLTPYSKKLEFSIDQSFQPEIIVPYLLNNLPEEVRIRNVLESGEYIFEINLYEVRK